MDDDFVYEGVNGIYLTSRAHMIDDLQEIETAWAEKYAYVNPNYSWILGKYVEADRANSNRQKFSFEDLRKNKGSLSNAALNINHSRLIVGTVAASEIVFPVDQEAADAQHPYVDTLTHSLLLVSLHGANARLKSAHQSDDYLCPHVDAKSP